jgi:hypothetical protein
MTGIQKNISLTGAPTKKIIPYFMFWLFLTHLNMSLFVDMQDANTYNRRGEQSILKIVFALPVYDTTKLTTVCEPLT